MHRRIARSTAGSIPATSDGRARRRILRVLAAIVRDAPGVERPLARVELVEHEAERVEVASDRRALAGELLGRHVSGRPADLRLGPDLARRHGQAEVHDARAAAAVDHHVGRLQVAVQDAAVVRRGEARAELARDLERLVLRQPADPPEQRRQILAVDVLHREEVPAVHLADVVDAAHVRVRHLPRRPHLREEPIEQRPVRGEAVRQELQRDRLAELQVVGAVDLAHPAAADQPDDPIALREDGARREAARARSNPRTPGGRRARTRASPRRRRRDRRRRETRRHLRRRRARLAARAAGRVAAPDLRAATRAAHAIGNPTPSTARRPALRLLLHLLRGDLRHLALHHRAPGLPVLEVSSLKS